MSDTPALTRRAMLKAGALAAGSSSGSRAHAVQTDEMRGALTASLKASFVAGLALVDSIGRQRHGLGFLAVSAADREAIVATMAEKEADPSTDEARFFLALKSRTVRGYYTSRMGIHDELNYKGNTMQEEYAGIDVSPPR